MIDRPLPVRLTCGLLGLVVALPGCERAELAADATPVASPSASDEAPETTTDAAAPEPDPAVAAAVVIPESLVLRVTGSDYQWHVLNPGPDGALGTADDFQALRHLRVPANTRVRLELESEDYMYQLAVPDFDVREIAVPDLHFWMEFSTGDPGKHRIEGDQFCGFAHPDLRADLVVMDHAAYRSWIVSRK